MAEPARPSPSRPSGDAREVALEELVDPEVLAAHGADAPTPSRRHLQAALPPGWLVTDDLRRARRDLRLLFRRGWLLVLGMVLFGAAGAGFFVEVLPGGLDGVLRFGAMIVVLLLVGGVVGPLITRALQRRG